MAGYEDRAPVLAVVGVNSPPCPELVAMAPSNTDHPPPIVMVTNQVHFCPSHRMATTPAQSSHSNHDDLCY